MPHSKYSPSSAPRWVACQASVASLELDKLPDPPSRFSLEGTANHFILEDYFSNPINPKLIKKKTVQWVDEDTKEKHKINVTKIKWIAEEAIEIVNEIIEKEIRICNSGVKVLTETRLFNRQLHQYSDLSNGTADILILSPRKIHVIDLKAGSGIEVNAVKNLQLAFYGAAALDTFQNWDRGKKRKLKMSIVQPPARSKKVLKSWAIPARRTPWFHEYYSSMFHAAIMSGEFWSPGFDNSFKIGDHCKWCGVENCPALINEIKDMFK